MINIMGLLGELWSKIHEEYEGGFKYGHDYNILKAIIEHRNDKRLVNNLVKSLRDKILMGKVRMWMKGSVG